MNRILTKWYLYLAASAITVTSFCLAVGARTQPKETERIQFLVASPDMDLAGLNAKLEEEKPDGVKLFEARFLQLNSGNFGYLLSTMARTVDFFIVPNSYAESHYSDCVQYAANINQDYLNERLGLAPHYFLAEDYAKGFTFHKGGEKDALSSYITYENEEEKGDYSIFFSYKSKNIGELNHSKSELAFPAVRRLLAL